MGYGTMDMIFFLNMDAHVRKLYREYVLILDTISGKKQTLDAIWKTYNELKDEIKDLKTKLRALTTSLHSAV